MIISAPTQTPLPARGANTGVRTIVTTDQALALARHLLDPARTLPVAVVSIDPHSIWSIDASAVSDAVTPLAEVVQITNGPLTRAFALAMPDQCQVYASAARVYPAGTSWATNPRTTQLRIARTPTRAAEITRALADDALTAAYANGTPATTSCDCDNSSRLRAELRDAQQEARKLRTQLAETATAPRHGSTHTAHTAARRPAEFTDPEAQFRFDIYLDWARRIPAGDKAARPLPARYEVDPQLLADLTRRAIRDEYPKVVAVTVEILTGLAPQITSRRVHRLRAGRGGNNPVLRSDAGTAILRADIQTNSPAAQRIHWTTTPDGTIRMLSVTLHDEYLAAA